MYNGECVKHGCDYGYYRYAAEDDYICMMRENDPWLVKSDDDNNNKSKLSAGAIAGIVIGVIVGVALIAVLIWYFVSKK